MLLHAQKMLSVFMCKPLFPRQQQAEQALDAESFLTIL